MSYRPQVKADSNGTTQDLPIDAETVQGKTPVFTTTSQTISGVKIYKDTQKFESDIDISGTTTFGPKLLKSHLNSDGTITERGTLLSNKYAPINYSPERVLDYGDTNKTIKIGYSGSGLTASQILYIAGYTAGADDNEHKIKDISKDVLKTWLGYAEVATGTFSNGQSLTLTTSTYLWIILPTSNTANTFSFKISSASYTCYHFALIQSGQPGVIRRFSSATNLTLTTATSITFSSEVNYVRFKI